MLAQAQCESRRHSSENAAAPRLLKDSEKLTKTTPIFRVRKQKTISPRAAV